MVEDFVMPIYEKRPTSKKDQSILPLLGFSMHEKTGLLAFKVFIFFFKFIYQIRENNLIFKVLDIFHFIPYLINTIH